MHAFQTCQITRVKIYLLLFIVFWGAHIIAVPLNARSWSDFQKKSVKTAIEDLERSKDSKKRVAAAKLLKSYDTSESIAALAKSLVSDSEPKVREQAASSLWNHMEKAKAAQQSLFKALNDPSPTVRIRASWALTALGVPPEKLVKARRSVLAEKDTTVSNRFWAAKGLIDFDHPETLVLPILEYSKGRLRSKAAESALKKLVRKQDRRTIQPMREVVSKYHKGNGLILEGMTEFAPPVEDIVQLLCHQLPMNDKDLSDKALILLRNHTKKAEEVSFWLPLVKPFTRNPEYSLRYSSVMLLGNAEGLAYDALPELLQVVQNDSEPSIRSNAIEAIGKIGDLAKPFSSEVKVEVGKKAVPLLIKVIANDPEDDVRRSAIRTLPKLQADPDQVVPVYVQTALRDNEDVLVRMSALQALNDLGSVAKDAVPDIRKLLDHPDSAISNNALWAIKAIEQGDVPVSKALPTQSGKDAQQKKALSSLRKGDATFDERGFMMALQKFDIEKVKAYLDSGVPVNYQFAGVHDKPVLNTVFDTTSMFAMQKKPTPQKVKELVQLLLDRGANPNLTDKAGNTALMMASFGCDEELLQMLIDGGADPHAKNSSGLTAIQYAIPFVNPGAHALIKAGNKLPASEVESYKKTYAGNPEALKLIERASP